jgi:hypothetical protein
MSLRSPQVNSDALGERSPPSDYRDEGDVFFAGFARHSLGSI